MHTIANEAASKSAGRPIFDQLEIVEIRFAGDRQKVAVFPAHDVDPNATRDALAAGTIHSGDVITYAMAHPTQYRRFKSMEAQDVSGTPLSEAPFLQQSKRLELRALNIHTVEALAALDGTPLKQIGMGGRELKNQAIAYLEKAAGSADVTAMAAQIVALQQQLKDRDDLIDNYASRQKKGPYQRGVERSLAREAEDEQRRAAEAGDDGEQPVEPQTAEEAIVLAREEGEDDPEAAARQRYPQLFDDGNANRATAADQGATKALDDCSDAELKAFISAETGEPVKGNPSRATLIKRATELAQRDAD